MYIAMLIGIVVGALIAMYVTEKMSLKYFIRDVAYSILLAAIIIGIAWVISIK